MRNVGYNSLLLPELRFYRASIYEGGLGSRNSVCSSVCPSVCLLHAWVVTNLNGALQIFWYHTEGQSLCYSDTRRRSLPSEICAQSDTPLFEKRRLRQISAYNVSIVRNSEKSSITTNIKSTTRFSTRYRWSAYVIHKYAKGWLSFLPERDYLTFGSLLSQIRLSVCLSATLVHPTQGVEAFGKFFLPLCTLAILWPPCKILRRLSQGNPSVGSVKRKRGSKIPRF